MLISKFDLTGISEKIEAFEERLGKKLPEQLCEFLMKYNGGETPNTNFSYNNVSSDVRAFYGLGKVKYSFDNVDLIVSQGKIYIPFACDSFGNEMIIDLQSGAVFFMNHEKDRLEQIANDLRGFIYICESKGISHESLKSVEEREQDLLKKGRGKIITDDLREMWKAEIEKYSLIRLEKVIL